MSRRCRKHKDLAASKQTGGARVDSDSPHSDSAAVRFIRRKLRRPYTQDSPGAWRHGRRSRQAHPVATGRLCAPRISARRSQQKIRDARSARRRDGRSGADPAGRGRMRRATIVTRQINPATLVAEVQSKEFGAVSLFVGTVRDTNDDRSVMAIEYSAYTSMAESELATILVEAENRFGVTAMVFEHRIGELALGDVSVAIAAAHAHRAPAMDCTRFLIEEIKKRVPIWKLEHYTDGGRDWVDPTRVRGVVGA